MASLHWTQNEKLLLNGSNSWFNIRRAIARRWHSIASSKYHAGRSSSSFSKQPLSDNANTHSTTVFVLLCGIWYSTSALSSNTGKAILMQFRYPVTLTIIQFAFVALYSLLLMTPFMRFSHLRRPTRAIINSTLPMGLFQVGGHMFSSMAISRIPVSTVHTIKALSPLFTVAAYSLLFGVSYSAKTYTSLLPLTLGVMLACSFDVSASDFIGLACAFGSALVFVSSNIFFKKIMPTNSSSMSQMSSPKLDKLNLLLYSSGMAFIFMIPIWIYSDFSALFGSGSDSAHIAHPPHTTHHSLLYYFFMNGTVHFGQNIIAFIILSSTSPVTYSIASLIKRVAVICIAIVWFAQSVHPLQGCGILLTFAGLYMYNNAKGDVEKGENKMRSVRAQQDLMLPVTKGDARLLNGTASPPPPYANQTGPEFGESTGRGVPTTLHGRPRAPSNLTLNMAPKRQEAHHHQHHQPHPSLTIQVTPPSASYWGKDGRPVVSPGLTEPYPSPPPSLDSPPSTAALLSDFQDGQNRLLSVN